MATRFYLPSSGTAPLGSLAVDANWEQSNYLVRLPTKITKANTSLVTQVATWPVTTTVQWVWRQFQSPCLASGYSWTTSDTTSMVVKCAEATAATDSHLAYSIRIVSTDGSSVRGTAGLYHATSSEYPTSFGTAATRIHSARGDGSSNFSSQVGDRVIIEIGHHGVTPAASGVWHRYGDPSATNDFALTAGLTTDLCPWVELSKNLDFDFRGTKAAFTKGRSTISGNHSAYTEGTPPTTPASDNQNAYTKGKDTTSGNKSAYTRGKLNATPSNKNAYTKGGIGILDSQNAYTRGRTSAVPDSQNAFVHGKTNATPDNQNAFTKGSAIVLDNQNAFTKGRSNAVPDSQNAYTRGISVIQLDSQNAFTKGSSIQLDSKNAYLNGSILVTDNKAAYTEGYTTGGPASSSKAVFTIGLGSDNLYPDGDVSTSGIWWNELNNTNNLYQSIDEVVPNDNDFIWDTNPTSNHYYECSLSNPIGLVGSGEVVVFWRGRDKSGLNMGCTLQLRQGITIIAEQTFIELHRNAETHWFQLTPEEIANITDWNDLRVRIIVTEL